MISDSQNAALLIIGNAACKNTLWQDYANYCFDREKGLRKEAFVNLNKFLTSTNSWDSYSKIEFIKFLFSFLEKTKDADYGPFPQPLKDIFLKPSLKAWCEIEKSDSSPFRWYGKYFNSEEHLHKALILNPADDLARQTLIEWWSYNIYYSVHHLPEGYIGNPYEDIEIAKEIKQHIKQLTNPELKHYWESELDEDLELVYNYIDWKNSGHPNLEAWGKEQNKKVSYNITRLYYDDKQQSSS